MNDEATLKELCKKICKQLNNQQFSFAFDDKMIIGNVINIKERGLSVGVKDNLMGDTGKCAELFFTLILMNVCQIRDMTGVSSYEAIYQISKRLFNCADCLDEFTGPLGFQVKNLHEPGNA